MLAVKLVELLEQCEVDIDIISLLGSLEIYAPRRLKSIPSLDSFIADVRAFAREA